MDIDDIPPTAPGDGNTSRAQKLGTSEDEDFDLLSSMSKPQKENPDSAQEVMRIVPSAETNKSQITTKNDLEDLSPIALAPSNQSVIHKMPNELS